MSMFRRPTGAVSVTVYNCLGFDIPTPLLNYIQTKSGLKAADPIESVPFNSCNLRTGVASYGNLNLKACKKVTFCLFLIVVRLGLLLNFGIVIEYLQRFTANRCQSLDGETGSIINEY